jgi:hypothetical protein
MNGIARQPKLLEDCAAPAYLIEEFVEHAEHEPENLGDHLTKLAPIARRVLSEVTD